MKLIESGFFRSIKFKLAMMFTVILFVFAGTIILLFNMAIDNYLSTRSPQPTPVTAVVRNEQQVPAPENDEQREMRAVYSGNLQMIQEKSVISLIPLAAICFMLGYFLAGRFLKPLNDLNRQIDVLKSDNLGIMIQNVPDNEIGRTMRSFNEMSLRLQSSFEQQSRFVQDASHELRTPLTIVRTNLETVLDDPGATENDLKESMREALNGLDDVTGLANDLLTLSSSQSRRMIPADLGDLVRECAGTIKDLAKKMLVTMAVTGAKVDIPVSMNRAEMTRVFKNIIENAIRYSRECKAPRVQIKVSEDGNFGIVEIIDNGVGIPKKDVSRIFDRFYRVDKSRDRETGGFGLGLPIAKKIVTDHGGAISVKSRPGRTVFTVKIPKYKNT
jgi:signal transduction histidine kinase